MNMNIIYPSTLIALLLMACDESKTTTDAGRDSNIGTDTMAVPDTVAVPDTLVATDALTDTTQDTANLTLCRGSACVEPCGLTTLEGSLEATLNPTFHVCNTGFARQWQPTGDNTGTLFSIHDEGGQLIIRKTDINVLNKTASTTMLGSIAAPSGLAGMMPTAYTSPFLAVNGTATHFAFGYTNTDSEFTGFVFRLSADGMSMMFSSRGNYGAAWITNNVLLVNAMSLGSSDNGQGLYMIDFSSGAAVSHLLTNVGTNSGAVAFNASAGLIFTGGYSTAMPPWQSGGASPNRVFAIQTASVIPTPVAVRDGQTDNTVAELELPSTFSVGKTNSLITYDFVNLVEHTYVQTLSPYGVTLGSTPRTLASGSTFGWGATHGTRYLLGHFGGVLIAE